MRGGANGSRWQLGVDKAALLWLPHSRSWRQDLDLRLGRFDNPFATNGELVFDQDLMFEGASASFEWNRVRVVTCTAQNSSGYQFPVTEDAYYGYTYQSRMEQIEDAALNRCYSETNGDESCYLLGCTAGY